MMAETEKGNKINKALFCATLEPPDRLNRKNRSSIPAKQYRIERTLSGRWGETFEICDIPGRNLVRFHPGNRVKDTEGCPLLGEYWGKLAGDRAVLNSGKTFERFMQLMAGFDVGHLTISEVY